MVGLNFGLTFEGQGEVLKSHYLQQDSVVTVTTDAFQKKKT
jgi:hypothetical protein